MGGDRGRRTGELGPGGGQEFLGLITNASRSGDRRDNAVGCQELPLGRAVDEERRNERQLD